jgi:hypothetical protein
VSYRPEFKCPYCQEPLSSGVTGPAQGWVGLCSCEESRRKLEQQHYEQIEARKQARRRRGK